MLRAFQIELLVDVRRYPASRRHPHFSAAPLADSLERAGIDDRHEEALGGYRDARADSPHGGLDRAGFRAYADHMDTGTFRSALSRLLDRVRRHRVAILCAEADPDRCHRRMIADAAVARDHRVIHILGSDASRAHELDDRARIRDDGSVAYPPPVDPQGDLFENV